MNLFAEEIEQTAIERIQKFSKIAKAMNFEIALGMSGGKDSQVCYDLCKRSGIEFKSYFNHSFESNITLKFIKENYPDVTDCFIYAREKAKQNGAKIDWIITSDNKDYSNDKVYYICRWLNHSFMPFTAKQEKLYLKFREKYDLIHNKNNNL